MVRLWEPAGGQEMARLQHDNTITLVTFSPDGTRLATSTAGHTIRLWDTASGREVTRPTSDDAVTRAGFSPDGARLLVVGGSTGLLLDAATGGELARVATPPRSGTWPSARMALSWRPWPTGPFICGPPDGAWVPGQAPQSVRDKKKIFNFGRTVSGVSP